MFLLHNIKKFYSLNIVLDLEKISINFSKIVESTIMKHNPTFFKSWMLSRIKFKVFTLKIHK